MKTLFKNTDILVRENDGYKTINKGFLVVENEYISYIGQDRPEFNCDIEYDFSHHLLMPGLVNAHTHIPMVFLRGIANGHSLQEWLNDYIFPIEARLTAKEVKAASYYAILELLASGVTSFTDMYFFPEETAQAVIDSGIKANINKYVNCFDENEKIEDSKIPASIEFFKKYNGLANGRLKVDFSIHAEYTNKPHIVKEYSRLCKENNAIMHIHLDETKKEHEDCILKYHKTTTEWFNDLNTFDNKTTAAHGVWVNDSDIKILKEKGVTIVHNPTSNMMLGSGEAPIRKMIDSGINVALGTDGAASNNNLNMFEEMHLADIIHNGVNNDPQNISTFEVIDMATKNGAISQGRYDTGSLEVGKKADIIALDLHKIHLFPNFDSSTLITFSAQAGDVCMTMVDGKILYLDGNYLTLDKDKIIKDFKEAVRTFYK